VDWKILVILAKRVDMHAALRALYVVGRILVIFVKRVDMHAALRASYVVGRLLIILQ